MATEKAIADEASAVSKLSDPTVLESLCGAAREGMTITDACTIAGIATSTYRLWRKRHREGIEPYASAYEAVQAARVDGKRARLARITKAGKGGAWQADAWYLERMYPSEFGRRVEHKGDVTVSLEDQRAKAREIAKQVAAEMDD